MGIRMGSHISLTKCDILAAVRGIRPPTKCGHGHTIASYANNTPTHFSPRCDMLARLLQSNHQGLFAMGPRIEEKARPLGSLGRDLLKPLE